MNKPRTLASAVVALAAVAAIGACSNSAKEVAQSAAPTPPSSAAATSAPAAHNQADAMFAQMMIPHHQQAIQMSDTILAKQGIDARVVDLAKQIKAAQGPEIQQMQGWLTQWGTPGMGDMPGMSGMPGMPGMGHMPAMGDMPGMDGMMSPADMQALQNAQGVEASKLFLTQMVSHHQGAIAMAQNEIANGQFPDAVAMAKSIATSQQKEIDTMNQLLTSL